MCAEKCQRITRGNQHIHYACFFQFSREGGDFSKNATEESNLLIAGRPDRKAFDDLMQRQFFF